jgi:membrane protease YdiL (CAAX protease family)
LVKDPQMMDQTKLGRPLWLRVLQFPLVRLALLVPLFFLLIGISNGFRFQFAAAPVKSLVVAVGMALAGLVIYFVFVRFIERRPVRELSLTGMGRELGLGLLLGVGLCVLCFAILMLLGVYRIDGVNPVRVVLPALTMAISSGVLEELMWRGGLFRIVEESLGSWIALAISALVFGLSHYGNVEGALWGALAITIEAGVLLAAVYMVTRRLWIGIGLHSAWNFAQSGVFSGIVSGGFNQPGLFKSTVEGPAILTGGAFGLEASIVSVLVCTAAGLVMLMFAIRRGNIITPFWKRRG